MKRNKSITSILLAGLLFFSCTEADGLIDPPQKGPGEEIDLTLPYAAASMETVGSKFSTRAPGQSLDVNWGAPETRADIPKESGEAELKQVYVVQFNGTDPATSAVVKCGTASVNTNSGSVNFSFYPTGCRNRVYMVANVDLSSVLEGMKLSDFEARLETFTAATALPETGLPMCASNDFEPVAGEAAPQFNLKAMVAKVVFKCKVDGASGIKANPTVSLKQIANGTTYAVASDMTAAYRPVSLSFSDLAGGTTTTDADGFTVYTFYIPENIAGCNAEVTKASGRSLAKAQPKATYIEVLAEKADDNEQVTFVLFLGDPADVTDFNVQRNHVYTVSATILGFDIVDERVTMSNDLSAAGTANCYMVMKPGKYTFNALTMGNGVDLGSTLSDPLLTPAVLAPASAKMLWCTGSDVNAVVKNVTLADGKVSFETGTAEEGNAVIAVYDGADGSGNILWSWHIWRLKARPADVVCLKFDKDGNSVPFTMMEYNLGAYNNTPKDVGSLGLLYQWGRKDPFPNANSSAANSTTATPTVGDLVYKLGSRNTLDYAIKNPTTFMANGSSPYDWISVKNDNLWGNPWVSNMTVAAQTVNSAEGAKSIYDPCPPGYRVPPQDTWTRAKNWANNANMGAWDATNLGFRFTEMTADRSVLWFPGAGLRTADTGALLHVGSRGHGWSASACVRVLAAGWSASCAVRARASPCAGLPSGCGSFRPVCLRTLSDERSAFVLFVCFVLFTRGIKSPGFRNTAVRRSKIFFSQTIPFFHKDVLVSFLM